MELIKTSTNETELDYTFGVGIPGKLVEKMHLESHVLFTGIWNYGDFGHAIAQYDGIGDIKNYGIESYEELGKECHDGAWEIDFEEGYALKFD
ncbi:hypothetical protein [Paenibacillus glucanolyticus]|uniref:hypothetical protein n=1 Tax=Paenibacillus glucanolyticus TaxID=59843 RepID=UPI0030D0848E